MKHLEHRGGNIQKCNQGELLKITERLALYWAFSILSCMFNLRMSPLHNYPTSKNSSEREMDTQLLKCIQTRFFYGFVTWSLGKTMCDVGLQSLGMTTKKWDKPSNDSTAHTWTCYCSAMTSQRSTLMQASFGPVTHLWELPWAHLWAIEIWL